MEEPPPFQEAAACVSCHSPFTTFKRRHHCRECGRSFCKDHSANLKALPQFRLYSPVRVCDECSKNSRPPDISTSRAPVLPAPTIDSSTSKFSKLDVKDDDGASYRDDSTQASDAPPFDCTCGMPLCICEGPSASKVGQGGSPAKLPKDPPKSREPKRPPAPAPSRPKQTSSLSTGNGMPSLFFSSGKASDGAGYPLSKSYDLSGEGIRESVKNGDVKGVGDLLSKGVDVNYVDKQGMSLLHLAAMFNFTEITFVLMDRGANLYAKNAQGETPLDCAQKTLAHKMRLRIGSSSQK